MGIYLYLIYTQLEGGLQAYYRQVVLMNGLGGVLTLIPLGFLYKRDRRARLECGVISKNKTRGLSPAEGISLLFVGAALALLANLVLSFFGSILNTQEYTESMEQVMTGKSLWFLIFWIGIVGPFYEEVLFRWVVYLRLRDYLTYPWAALISGVMFGIYHGNLTQFVYATILGFFFSCFLEWSGSLMGSVLLHMGANIWSLLLSEYGESVLLGRNATEVLIMLGAFVVILLMGIQYFSAKGKAECRQN
jgi:membrane protease YdiL (CAAX protease family)